LTEVIGELRLRAARDMYAEGVEAGDGVESLRLRMEHGVIDGRAGRDTVIDLSAADDAAADGAAITAHLGDGDVASLELSLLAPLPHVVIDSGRIVFSGTRDEFDCLRSSAGPSNSGRRSRQMSIASMSQFGRASWKRLTNASAPAEDAASFRGEHLRWKSFATGSALYRLCVTREPGSRRRRW